MNIQQFVNTPLFEWIILPILLSYGIAYTSRYMGREFEKCENWKNKIELFILITGSSIINYFVIILFMFIAFNRAQIGY